MQSVIRFLKNVWNAQELAGFEKFWRDTSLRDVEQIKRLEDENAALRSQINQRGAGGKFTKKSPAE